MGVRLHTLTGDRPGAPGGGTAAASRAELIRALAALAEEPRPEHRRLAALLELPAEPEPGAYADLFLMNLYPWASVHLGEEGMLGGEARDRVAGFWRALGLTPPPEPDHLGAILGLLASLAERVESEDDEARRALLVRARRALAREHLLPWAPLLLEAVRDTGDPYYAPWATLLLELLEEEASAPAGELDTLPVHLAEAPPLQDPRDPGAAAEEGAGEAFLRALLAPVRSGMLLTRRDLARAGKALGLGVRKGERLFVLKAFLAQDTPGTLRWLAGEARRQGEAHRARPGWDDGIKTFWEGRAEAAARLLEELAATSEGETDHA